MNKCDICDIKFSTKGNLKRHMSKHDLKFKCQHCRKKFNSKDEKEEHEKDKHPTVYCNICNYHTFNKKLLMRHYEKTHRPLINQKRKHELNEIIKLNAKKIKLNDANLPPPPPHPPILYHWGNIRVR